MLKLHLGCGQRQLKGFVHVDINDFDHIDHRHDIKTLPMFEDDSVDEIYSSHSLEYFDREEVKEVLKEWRRVLKQGGILRLAVPDFEALAKVYEQKKDLNLLVGPLYGRWPLKDGHVLYHKTTYDFKSLKNVLEEAGFSNMKRWDWREVFVGDNEGYDDYSQAYIPHMDKDNGQLTSLNIEGQK